LSPVGDSISGQAAGWPNILVSVRMCETSTRTSGTSSYREKADMLRASVTSSSAPPSI